MTPKEKAEELILKYLRIDNNTQEWFNKYIAKQCALIAVDEIMSLNSYLYPIKDLDNKNEYWQEVKEEINKL